MNFLACDLGGTKVLLGIFEKVTNDDSPKLICKKKYISSNWDSFELILEDFLKNECTNITHPSSACFAVAGPLSNNKAQIINLSWDISGKALQSKFNLKSRLGAILDPLSDKVFYLIPLVFLCKNNLIPFWSLSLILFRELIISSLRNSTKDGLPASMLGKFKTFFFFISVITFFTPLKINLLNNLALIFYWLGFILTFVTLLGYLRIKKNMI